MNSISKFSFSIEKGFRIFESASLFFHFFMIQIPISKKIIQTGSYLFLLKHEKPTFSYSKKLYIDIEKKIIITENSHEDPLIEGDENYLICFQIDIDILKHLKNTTMVFFQNDQTSFFQHSFINLSKYYQNYFNNHYSSIKNHCIYSQKDCTLTLHLSSEKKYEEKVFFLHKNQSFDFKKYIQKYDYIGLQCSYEKEIPEIEEKHIIVGQKGIVVSGYFYDKNVKIMPPFLFQEQYQKQYSPTEFQLINDIETLISYYQQKSIIPQTFESQFSFLKIGYEKQLTYNQDKIYSNLPLKKQKHYQLNICKNCPKSFRCLQTVPSGLSYQLLQKNITLENHQDCEIYHLF